MTEPQPLAMEQEVLNFEIYDLAGQWRPDNTRKPQPLAIQ